MLIYHSENSWAIKNFAKSTLPGPYKWNHNTWMIAHLFKNWFTKYFKPPVRPSAQKRIFSKYYCHWQCTWSPKSVMETDKEINVVFLPANTTFILQPMDQGTTFTYNSYYLRNACCRTKAAIVIPLMNLSKVIWKLSRLTILDTIKNTQFMGRGKNSNIERSWFNPPGWLKRSRLQWKK